MKKMYRIVLAFLIVFSIPIIIWFIQPKKQVKVAVIDKSITTENTGDTGLEWLLNYNKVTDLNEESFEMVEDSYGHLVGKEENPSGMPENYQDYDLVYLANTAGIEGQDNRGFTTSEWKDIIDWTLSDKDTTLLAEFNSFGPESEPAVVESASQMIEGDISDWIGRFSSELNYEENPDLPNWLLDNYQGDWSYEGPGLILYNQVTNEVVILPQDQYLAEDFKQLAVDFSQEMQDLADLPDQVNYFNWFNIVDARNDDLVLAHYYLPLNEAGKDKFEEMGLPLELPAILKGHTENDRFIYFTGAFSYLPKKPYIYQAKGLAKSYQVLEAGQNNAFYWQVFVPLMTQLVRETNDEKIAIAEESKSDQDPDQEITYHARVGEDKLEILDDAQFKPLTLKGVDIGMADPGSFPGDAAITKEEYFTWFEQIGEMNANAIRVYTIHPPAFYEALLEYNQNHEDPIYLFHGTWINEEILVDTGNAFDDMNLDNFRTEAINAVDVVHGNAMIEHVAGHASGHYSADVSDYLIGWIIGIEWDPDMVVSTNEINQDVGQYEGENFKTEDANPFEHWLAREMDFLASYQIEHYHKKYPMAFTNWVTTDPLAHPSDATDKEDLVSVNPDHVKAIGEMEEVGHFGSYHVYPYYPDFIKDAVPYREYVDHRGEQNNYAGYLNDLQDFHDLPILISEFGIPASRGLTHRGANNKNQGGHSEAEQAELLVDLFEDIIHEGYMGGLVFTWQDEWFKRTWNTMDYDNPNRRPFWSNVQTSEQRFGVLGFDPEKITIDGNDEDWKDVPVNQEKEGLGQLKIDQDESYLYLNFNYDQGMNASKITFLIDTLPNQGNQQINHLTGSPSLKENGLEFMINIDLSEAQESRLLVDTSYDYHTYLYGYLNDMIELSEPMPSTSQGDFTSLKYALNREYWIPDQEVLVPFEDYETGRLRPGNSDRQSPDFNSLTDYHINDDEGIIEVRIPWLLINASDPSRKEFLNQFNIDGEEGERFAKVEDIKVGTLALSADNDILDSIQNIEDNEIEALSSYTWENWEVPNSRPYLKQAYYDLADLFEAVE